MGIGCVLIIIGHTTDPDAFGPGMISLIAGSIGVFGSDYMEENK